MAAKSTGQWEFSQPWQEYNNLNRFFSFLCLLLHPPSLPTWTNGISTAENHRPQSNTRPMEIQQHCLGQESVFIFSPWGLFVSGFVISAKSVMASWGLFATPQTRNINYVPKLWTQMSTFGNKAITCLRLGCKTSFRHILFLI